MFVIWVALPWVANNDGDGDEQWTWNLAMDDEDSERGGSIIIILLIIDISSFLSKSANKANVF